MIDSKIEQTILSLLYEAFFSEEGEACLTPLCENYQWDKNEYDKTLFRLCKQNLIEIFSSGGMYKITSSGILYCEKNDIASEVLIRKNKSARTHILNSLYDIFEKEGPYSEVLYSEFSKKIEQNILEGNLTLLLDMGYIKYMSLGSFSIEEIAIENVVQYKNKLKIANEYNELKEENPQKRGILFQKLISRIIGSFGWEQEESLKTSNEEIDVLFFKEREFFLVECKWEKKPIEAEIIRSFMGKLSNRSNINGIIFSMSSFSKGSIEQVKSFINQKLIVLFGPKDIESMILEGNSFNDLLNSKMHDLIAMKVDVK